MGATPGAFSRAVTRPSMDGHQGVAPVALGLAPAVRLDLDDAAVAQDRPSGEGRPEEQAAYELGRELVLDEVKEAVALGHRRVPSKVPCVERREAAAAQVPPVRFRLAVGVAGELERGVREDGVGRQGQEGLDLGRGHVGAHKGLEAPVGADRKVPGVGQRLGEEARAGDGVVDFGLGSRAGPVLGERGRELGVQFAPRVEIGHVALHLGSCAVGRQIHRARRGVGDGLVHLGPRVEVQQSRDDLRIDLGAVVVAGQGRGDGRGHRAAGGVVTELARHVGRDFRLVPIGHQLAGDEGQHLRLGPVLGQVEGVDGGGDRCARFRLGVGFAAGVAVRLDEDRVVQVLEAGGQGAGHGQVPEHVAAAPEQVERRPAGPGLAVAECRRRDGGIRLGRRVKAREGCHDCGVRVSGIVIAHEGCHDCGVPLGCRFEGHQRIGDGLVHLDRGAVIGQLVVGVGLALVDGRHHGHGNFGAGEVVRERGADGVVGLLRGVRIAAEAQSPVVVGELDAQGARGVEVADLVRAGQQVPGHVAQPGGGVDQVGGAAEGGDLRQDPVDGGLQGHLQVAEVSCRGEGRERVSPRRARRGGRPGGPVRPGRPFASGRIGAPWPFAGPRRPRSAGRPRRWPAGPPRSSARRSPRPSPGWRCWWK